MFSFKYSNSDNQKIWGFTSFLFLRFTFWYIPAPWQDIKWDLHDNKSSYGLDLALRAGTLTPTIT